MATHEELRVGLDYLRDVTVLAQRMRAAHPTAGLFEAADFQWWWRNPRRTDELPQLFWFDASGRPDAAAILTQWNGWVGLAPIVLPGTAPDRVGEVVERGLAHAAGLGIDEVELEVARTDGVLRRILTDRGFTVAGDAVVETWLGSAERPVVSPLPDGFRSSTRSDTSHRPHHMISVERGHTDPEPRLQQTSLYRPDLDLVVFDDDDEVAAYGLFWYDPVTSTGLVEPMRTEDRHQGRGLARHVLTRGLDLLARVGAHRVKICFEPSNPSARHVYLSTGFQPCTETDMFAGPTGGSLTR